MVKTQIQLPEEDLKSLRRKAAEEGVSVSELVREGVRYVLEDSPKPSKDELWKRARALSGKFRSEKGDVAQRHDDYLAEDFAK